TCSAQVSVVDSISPTATCSDTTVYLASNGTFTIDSSHVSGAWADACGVDSVSLSRYVFGCGDIASPVTVAVTTYDMHGNSSTCSAQVSVVDSIAPTIICPADTTVSNDPGNCSAVVNNLTPAINDNCSVVLQTWFLSGATTDSSNTTGINNVSGYNFNLGTTTVAYHIEDISGNSHQCSFMVTVKDTEKPNISCQTDIDVSNDPDSCGAWVQLAWPVASDNCAIDSIWNDYSNNADTNLYFPVGQTPVNWIVADAAGNLDTCGLVITVNDSQSPIFIMPADTTILCTGDTSAAATGVPTNVWDNCDASPIVSNTSDSLHYGADCEQKYTIQRIWTVTDNYGNAVVDTQFIYVVDTIEPSFKIPANIVLACDEPYDTASLGHHVYDDMDNCSSHGISFSDSIIAGICTDTIYRTWTLTDACGNDSSQLQLIIRKDTIAPVFIVPKDTTINYHLITKQCTPILLI
ncbi:MAG: HYR domain-containing protein, partial [Bacteroidales bacterium]|nr:HYR domain-containing protein [Bacteroidales bacterium]